jgi:hypothetical protein
MDLPQVTVVGPQVVAASLIPPPPTVAVWIEDEQQHLWSNFFLFLFWEMAPSVGEARPTKDIYFSSVPTKNMYFSLIFFRRPKADGS